MPKLDKLNLHCCIRMPLSFSNIVVVLVKVIISDFTYVNDSVSTVQHADPCDSRKLFQCICQDKLNLYVGQHVKGT